MNLHQGGGGQFPQQGPRRLLKQRTFPKDGPIMTSTPYQDYPGTAPAPGFNMTPQMNNDYWQNDPAQQFQGDNNIMYNNFGQAIINNVPQAQQMPMYEQHQQPFMTPHPSQQMPSYNYADIINNPLVQNVVSQYGKNFIDTAGGQMINKVAPVGQLKNYFAVDTRYVMKKLKLIVFPYLHKDWSVQPQQDQPIQPRYDINAPDLYIPVMAYVTYVLLAGLVLGLQDRFSPEKLGIHASTAFACTTFEIIVELLFLYLTNIQSSLGIFDLVAYSGYKYVGIIIAILVGQIFLWSGYWISILYCGISVAYFVMKTLNFRVMESPTQTQSVQQDVYGNYNQVQQPNLQGTKRRYYFLIIMAVIQPFLMAWVSYHLISSHINTPSNMKTTSPPL